MELPRHSGNHFSTSLNLSQRQLARGSSRRGDAACPSHVAHPAFAQRACLQESNRNITYRFFTSAMPRNAFLGIPRIWFSLRSLNKKRRGTGVKDPARLYLHLIMITKPLWWLSLRSVFGGLFSLRPRAGSSPHIVPLEMALLKWLAGGRCLQGGLCGWSRTSRPRAKRWVNCCTLHPVLFCHLQEMTPSSPPP